MEFRLLGRLEVEVDGVDLAPVRPKQRALLAVLLLREGEIVPIDELVEVLWGSRPPKTVQTALYGHVSALRKCIGSERIETRPPGYRLLLAGGDEFDIRRFERVVAAARCDPPFARSQGLGEELELFRGEPLFEFRDEQFASLEAARLAELRLAVVEEQIEAELELGRHVEVLPRLERLVADHPFRERPRAQLMLALYGAGRQAEALLSFQQGRELLVDELGIDPGPALQRLQREILNHHPGLAVPDASSPARNVATKRVNLPPQPTSFVGRGREIREVTELLGRSDVRLVTLTGTGGVGKTRLAVQVAAGLLGDFGDGVVFVGFASLKNVELVATTVANALGVLATSSETPAAEIGRHLRNRELLLVFDNFEHVLAAVPLVAGIVAAAAGVKVLVTSRSPLRLSAERVYPVSPLDKPAGGEDLERLLKCTSVELFDARARAAKPDFSVTSANAGAVADICKALDGLPLALELAALRVGSAPLAALRERLDRRLTFLKGGARDSPERQQTLRATIDWSYDLLEPADQRLFVQLAVFAGGWTIDAAQSVCGNDLEVFDGLASLTDIGLVYIEGTEEAPRFTILETIREYAVERLEASDEAARLHRRHAEHFLALAEEAEPSLFGIGTHTKWRDQLGRDHDNFRAALDWLEASGDTDGALRLAAALWRFWDMKGHLVEGRRRLEGLLCVAESATAIRAKALAGAADMALTAGDVVSGRRWAEEALKLNRTLGDEWGTAFSLRSLAWAHHEGGNLETAREITEANLRQARATHDELLEGVALSNLGDYAMDEGRIDEAFSLVSESYRVLGGLDDRLMIAAAACRLARAFALAGRARTASLVLSSATVLLEEIGASPPWLAKIGEKTLAAIARQLDEVAFADAWQEGLRLTTDEAVALALTELV